MGLGGQRHALAAIAQNKSPGLILYRRTCGPQSPSGGVQRSKNISIQRGFKPRTVQSLYRLRLGHPTPRVVLEESAVFVFKREPTLKMEAAGLAITITVIAHGVTPTQTTICVRRNDKTECRPLK